MAFGLAFGVFSAARPAVLQAQSCSGLTLNAADSPDPTNPGGPLTFTITFSRQTALLNATLTNALPSALRFTSLVSPAGTPCTTPAAGGSGTVSCTFKYDPERLYAINTLNQLSTFALHSPGTALSTIQVTGRGSAGVQIDRVKTVGDATGR